LTSGEPKRSFMKIGLAVAFVVVGVLGWIVFSMNATIHRQEEQLQKLTASLADKSQQQAFALQTECAQSATRFLVSRGWKASDGSDYENHFNSRLTRCFVLVSAYLPNDDFRTVDVFDAVEGRRYATYNGHNVCDQAITRNPRKCAMDSGAIWFDGNDSRIPPDFTVGFRGLVFGGGAGDERTQKVFLDRIRAFMTQ
jgi:hypothetical protein